MPPVPRQLPLDAPTFTGRADELSRLDALLPGRATRTMIAVITGTAGIGKTALASHWAHRVVDRFPDGQLWVNLHGHDPDAAVPPGRTLERFLRALGVPAPQIPSDEDEQAGLYRSLMDGRRMLVVLDNAGSPQQVRPLLPGAPGCLVLITSRHRLSGLVAAEGALPLELDLLTPAVARQLLVARLGAARIAGNPAAVDEIVDLCAGLPLTLILVAGHAASHPRLDLDTIAADFPKHRIGTHCPVLAPARRWRRPGSPLPGIIGA